MPKHKDQIVTLGEIIDRIPANSVSQWYEIMGIQVPGLVEALKHAAETDESNDAFDQASQIEADYVRAHQNDKFRVMWPEHVTSPKFNSDASYQPL